MKQTLLALVLAATLGLTPSQSAPRPQDDPLALLVQAINNAPDAATQADILRGMLAALGSQKSVAMPEGWPALYASLRNSANEDVRQSAMRLSATFGDKQTLEQARRDVADLARPKEARQQALQILIGRADASTPALLRSLLNDPALREQALAALGASDDPATPPAIIASYATFDVPAKMAALNTLSFRRSYARELMNAVKAGNIPSRDLTAYTIRQLRNFKDKQIDAWISSTWGVARTTPQQKLQEIAKYKAMLTPEALAKADPSAGRVLFSKTCQQCHQLFGTGGKVGPDLTGASRSDVDYLLVNIIDPSAVIPKDYQVTNVWTNDDQIISGIITREDQSSITIVTETSSTTLARAEISTMKKSEMSMMPEGQLLPMKQQEVIDLIAYLRSPVQVALPPGAQAGK